MVRATQVQRTILYHVLISAVGKATLATQACQIVLIGLGDIASGFVVVGHFFRFAFEFCGGLDFVTIFPHSLFPSLGLFNFFLNQISLALLE